MFPCLCQLPEAALPQSTCLRLQSATLHPSRHLRFPSPTWSRSAPGGRPLLANHVIGPTWETLTHVSKDSDHAHEHRPRFRELGPTSLGAVTQLTAAGNVCRSPNARPCVWHVACLLSHRISHTPTCTELPRRLTFRFSNSCSGVLEFQQAPRWCRCCLPSRDHAVNGKNLDEGLTALRCKGPESNMFSSTGPVISVAATLLCCRSPKRPQTPGGTGTAVG